MVAVDWDRRYSKKGFAYGSCPNVFLAEYADEFIPPFSSVLLLGEGEGRNAVYLAERGHSCTGVDSSAVGLAKARRLAAERGVKITTIVADLEQFDLGVECWDAIVSIFCHLPPAVRRRVHRSCVSALKPGGALLLEAFSPAHLQYRSGGPSKPDRLMSTVGLLEELPGLDPVVQREIVRDVTEGTYHQGLGAVTQYVGKKVAVSLSPSLAPPEVACNGVAAQGSETKSLQGTSAQYGEYLDKLFETLERPRVESVEVECGVEEDRLLANASLFVELTLREACSAGWCRYCWMPLSDCFCDKLGSRLCALPSLASNQFQWIVLCHPQEFLRSTSSGKLIAQALGGQFIVYGRPDDEEFPGDALGRMLRVALRSPRTRLLFPGLQAQSVETLLSEVCDAEPIPIVVLDGTWQQALAMFRKLDELRPADLPHLCCVQLATASVRQHESALINALRSGVGCGRVTTFEACALFLAEAECVGATGVETGTAVHALDVMVPLTEAVRQRRTSLEGFTFEVGENTFSRRDLASWTTALQDAANACVESSVPPEARACGLCGITVQPSAATRLLDHFRGRRHCQAVARNHLSHRARNDAGLAPMEGEATDVFYHYSIAPIARVSLEPADVALSKMLALERAAE